MTSPLVLPLITRVTALPPLPAVFIVWIRCGGSNVFTFIIPLSLFSKDPWLNYGYIHGGVLIPSMVAGHWSPSSRQCSRCATHLAVMPFEVLTLVLVHLPLLPFQSWTWWGDDFCTVISFVITDTLHLVWLASRSELSWCGHWRALPISWSHKWELFICGRPVFLSTSISKMCGLTGLQRCYSSWENG